MPLTLFYTHCKLFLAESAKVTRLKLVLDQVRDFEPISITNIWSITDTDTDNRYFFMLLNAIRSI